MGRRMVQDDRDGSSWLSCNAPTVGISAPIKGYPPRTNNSPNSYRLPSSICPPAGIDTPRKKPRTSTGPSRDSPSRESLVPENSTPRKRPRTSLKATCEGENTPPWHSLTPNLNVKHLNQVATYSATLQKSSPAKIESPSLKRVRTDSGVSSRSTDKGNTRKPNIRSPLATPTSCKVKRKLSCVDNLFLISFRELNYINLRFTPPSGLNPTQDPSTTSSNIQPSKNKDSEDCDPFA